MRNAADLRESVCRARNLAGGRAVGELERIRPYDRRQPRSLFIIRRQIKREREIDAVGRLYLTSCFLMPRSCGAGSLKSVSFLSQSPCTAVPGGHT